MTIYHKHLKFKRTSREIKNGEGKNNILMDGIKKLRREIKNK